MLLALLALALSASGSSSQPGDLPPKTRQTLTKAQVKQVRCACQFAPSQVDPLMPFAPSAFAFSTTPPHLSRWQIDLVREIRSDFTETQAYEFCSKHGFSAGDISEALFSAFEESPAEPADWQTIDKAKKKSNNEAASASSSSSFSSSSSSTRGVVRSSVASSSSSSSSADAPRRVARPQGPTSASASAAPIVNITLSGNGRAVGTPDLAAVYAAAANGQPVPLPALPAAAPKAAAPLQGAWGAKSFVDLVKTAPKSAAQTAASSSSSSASSSAAAAAAASAASAATAASEAAAAALAEEIEAVARAHANQPLPGSGLWAAGNPLTRKAQLQQSQSQSQSQSQQQQLHAEPEPEAVAEQQQEEEELEQHAPEQHAVEEQHAEHQQEHVEAPVEAAPVAAAPQQQQQQQQTNAAAASSETDATAVASPSADISSAALLELISRWVFWLVVHFAMFCRFSCVSSIAASNHAHV